MKKYIYIILLLMIVSAQAKAQDDCLIQNGKTIGGGKYKLKLTFGDQDTCGGGFIPDSLKFHRLSIKAGNPGGEKTILNKSIQNPVMRGENILESTLSVDSPVMYLRIQLKSDSNASKYEAVYNFNYFYKGGCLDKSFKLIPDSASTFITDSSSEFYRMVDTFTPPPPMPGQNPPGPGGPAPIGPIQGQAPPMNDSAFKAILQQYYKDKQNQKAELSLEVFPEIKELGLYNNTTDYLPTVDKIQLKAPTGYPKSVYRWQYRLVNLTQISQGDEDLGWEEFPDSVNYKSTLSINARSIMDSATCMANLNKTIYIRIRHCGGSSDILVKNIRLSAPRIKTLTEYPVTCVNLTNGKVKLVFNRKLYTNEKLFLIFNKFGKKVYNVYKDSLTGTDTVYTLPPMLEPGKYEIQLYGTLLANGEHSPTIHGCFVKFEIKKPAPVTFATSMIPALCYGNKDAAIKLIPEGGNGIFEIKLEKEGILDTVWKRITLKYDSLKSSFDTVLSKGYVSIDTLKAGKYIISVRDTSLCYSRENEGWGRIITDSIETIQPLDSLKISIDQLQQPKAYGFSDGKLFFHISGGTNDNFSGKYNLQWLDANSQPITVNYKDSLIARMHYVYINSIKSGVYKLRVRDANYTKASNPQKCELWSEFNIIQPDPIQIHFEDLPPSCNFQTQTVDLINNGTMTAHVTGGVRFTNGMPYIYNWQRYHADSGWISLNHQDSIFHNIGGGIYRLNVMDANGIVRGMYNNDTLVSAEDTTHEFTEPAMISFNATVNGVGCSGQNDGSIVPNVYGGTSPYTYLWDDGSTSPSKSDLCAGNYYLTVTDSNGCVVVQDFQVNGLFVINSSIVQPSCRDAVDGSLVLSIGNGGNLNDYSFSWINPSGHTDNELYNIGAGTYKVNVTDIVNTPSCTVQYQASLYNPPYLPLNINPSYTLCNTQELYLNADQNNASYTYEWFSQLEGNINSTSDILIHNGGLYTVKVYDWSNGGCMISNQDVQINTDPANIDADFLMPSHAYMGDMITLMNVSEFPADTFYWILPSGLTIKDTGGIYTYLQCSDSGSYPIKLISKVNSCVDSLEKSLVVTPNPAPDKMKKGYQPYILQNVLTQNNNELNLYLKLREPGKVKVKIYSVLGYDLLEAQVYDNSNEYTIVYDTAPLISGFYMLLVETAQERLVLKFIK